jgi:hypothetical protein
MKLSAASLVLVLLLGGVCAAQDGPSSSADENPNQSVAAAARANKAPKIDPAKEADIRRLLDITGAGTLATQTMDQMEKDMRPLIANALPAGDYREKLLDLFFEKFHSKRDPAELINLVVPVYDKYLSDDDIKGLIQLYQTPIGRKVIEVLPKVASESQAAGAKWGEQLGRECMTEVLAEHPDLVKALEESKKNSQPQ